MVFISEKKKLEALKRLTALRIMAEREKFAVDKESFVYAIEHLAELTALIGGEKALFETNCAVAQYNLEADIERERQEAKP